MGKKIRFTIKQAVRFRDLDAMGHVNNATYFTYMEEARKEFFNHLLNCASPEDFPFVLAGISCNFSKPIQLKDKVLAVDLWLTHLGRKSFTFSYELYRPDEPSWVFATGESVQVFYDYQQNKSIEIPTDFKVKVQQYLGPKGKS
ncbi:MAG TPA: acyl-CoA thioesterase [Proteobacteria bacterium]|nr:acyl-CoA thioesterase [Pseudomonadota bacterium]